MIDKMDIIPNGEVRLLEDTAYRFVVSSGLGRNQAADTLWQGSGPIYIVKVPQRMLPSRIELSSH